MASKQTAFRELDDAGLVRALAETKEELFNLRFQHVTGQLDNNSRLRQCAATSPASTPSSAPARSRRPKSSTPRGRTRDG